MKAQNANPHCILRRAEVSRRTGLSRSSLYIHMQRGEFPRPIQLSRRSVGWLEADIDNWITTRVRVDLIKRTIQEKDNNLRQLSADHH
jgi:prophage regulatory protein